MCEFKLIMMVFFFLMQLGVRYVWVDGVNTGFNSLGVRESFYFWSDVSIELWSCGAILNGFLELDVCLSLW